MSKSVFILGGQRSGKSGYAVRQAELRSEHPVYIATARIWDEDFRKRIIRHQQDRGPHWTTIEEEKYISSLHIPGKSVVVLDCVTLWLTNFFIDNDYDAEVTLSQAKQEWDKFIQKDMELYVISNEVGMSLHAQTETGRKFTDLQGWMNQYIASKSDEVYLMVAGIAHKIK